VRCARPCYELIVKRIPGKPNITVMQDGHAVSRSSDFIVYSVEAEYIDRVVAQYGPCRDAYLLQPACSDPK
jgi:hypothetical protein